MSTKNSMIQVRVRQELKVAAEEVLDKLGLTTSQAITLFLAQVALKGEIPFSISLPKPNLETQRAIIEIDQVVRNGNELRSYANSDELSRDLGL